MRIITFGLLLCFSGMCFFGMGCCEMVSAGDFQGETNPDSKTATQHSLSQLNSNKLDPILKGRILVEEHRCVACHKTGFESLVNESKVAPRLANVGKRVNPYYLEKFLNNPHSTKPGTTMPDLLNGLDEASKKETAKAITHFLVSLSGGSNFAPNVPDSVAAEFGHELFHSVGCVACHSPRDSSGKETMTGNSTPLGPLEGKYNVNSLVDFLSAPQNVRPSGRMPSMNLGRREYERIAHYLLNKTQVPGHLHYTLYQGLVWEGLDVNVDKIRAGHVDDFDLKRIDKLGHNSAIIYQGYIKSDREGPAKFSLQWNGGQLWINEKQVIDLPPSNRRGVKKSEGNSLLVAGWNRIKLIYYHTGREPKFEFKMEAPGGISKSPTSDQLSISNPPLQPFPRYQIDANLAKRGAKAFATLGCAQCHDDIQKRLPANVTYENPPEWKNLDSTRGCLGEKNSKAPLFALSSQQKKLIRDSLPTSTTKELTNLERANKSLATFNCTACHERDGLGGVPVEKNALFVGDKNELGNDGRIPPPLTLIGAKLNKNWFADVLFRGQRQRNYMATTMPQFGESNVGHLIELFEKTDSLEPVQFEKIKDISKVKQAGHLLIGTKGFSCIACHDFNGQAAAGPGAMDIIHATSRLKKDWFYEFMLKPSRFRKGTVMPASWPGGHVFMEDVLDGDAKKQIESLWIYLEDGIRAKNPEGLSRKSPELRVTDEALICRGRGTAGYRGMGIGYPERVSLAFDTQEMNLRLLWKGEFATVDNGRFSARGRDRVSFPQGIPFHRLKSLDDNWPYKRKTDYLFPQSEGYRFEGYSLGKQKRPTLKYRYGEIQVEDFFEDRLDPDKSPYFRRTMTLIAQQDQEEFYFRAGSGKKIERLGDNRFQIDQLKLDFKGTEKSVIRDGTPQELLFKIKVPKGKTVLTLEYRW